MNLSRLRKSGPADRPAPQPVPDASTGATVPRGAPISDRYSFSEYSGYDDSMISTEQDDDVTGYEGTGYDDSTRSYDDETDFDDDETGYDEESVPYSEDNSMRRLGTGFHGQADSLSFDEPYDDESYDMEPSMYDDEPDEYASDYEEEVASDDTAHADHDGPRLLPAIGADRPTVLDRAQADSMAAPKRGIVPGQRREQAEPPVVLRAEPPVSLQPEPPLAPPFEPPKGPTPTAVPAEPARKGFFRRFSRFPRGKHAQNDAEPVDTASKRASVLASIAQRKDHAQELRGDAEAALRGEESPMTIPGSVAGTVPPGESVQHSVASSVVRAPSPASSVETETESLASDPYAATGSVQDERSELATELHENDAQSVSVATTRSTWKPASVTESSRRLAPSDADSLRRMVPAHAPATSDTGSAYTRDAPTSSAPVRLRVESTERMPQLIDPFGGAALDDAPLQGPRPRSIEPSVLDGEGTSVHPASPLMPRTGPLSGQRLSDPSSLGRSAPRHKMTPSNATSSDFASMHTASPQASPSAARERVPRSKPMQGDVPPVPPLPSSVSKSGSNPGRPPVITAVPAGSARQRPSRKRFDFRDLEHAAPGSRRPAVQVSRDPQRYLLTPSNAPTESEPDEESRRETRPPPKRSWLLRDMTPEQTHYMLRELVSKELTWEWDRLFLLTSFDKPADPATQRMSSDVDSRAGDFAEEADGVTDDEAVFRRDVYDPAPTPVDLPLMRFLLRNAFCTFPLFVPPERTNKQGRAPSKAALARTFFFTAVMPLLRETQARSLSSTIERHGQSDGMPFMAQSVMSALWQLLHKWATRYITAVLRVGPGHPYYGAEPVHNAPLPWPNARLLPPEAFVSYRRPTERLRLGGMEVDIVAVREHAHHSRDFLLRIRRPNRMDEFVVRNDHDWDEFRAKLAQELGPFVHVRPLPRLPGREMHSSESQDTSEPDSLSYDSGTSYDDSGTSPYDESSYDSQSTVEATGVSRPPEGITAADILEPLYGSRARPVPPFEVDRRLLRSWLRDTLAIRSVGESNEVRAFLSIGCFHDRELDTDELLNIAERRRVDSRRIQEREKDAEMAGEHVLSIRRVAQRIWADCVDGDGFLKMYDAIKATPDFSDLPTSYQTMVSWGHLQAARFLYGIFVQGDQSRANLARVRDLVELVPWRKLANAMRLPAIQAVREWQKQFLRNRFLQSLFEIVFDDNPAAMDETLRTLQQAIGSDTMIRKLRLYVESPEDMKRLVRQHADQADIPLVAAIVRGSDSPKLTKAEVERVMLATREYNAFLQTHPNAAKRRQNNSAGYQLILNLQRVLRVYSLHRDVTQIRGMMQDPAILDALTVFFEPLLEALVRVQRVDGVREDLLDLHTFLVRLLDLLESLRARVQDPARSINTLAAFLDRGAPAWYDFLHRWAQVDPVVFSTFAWLRHLAMTIGTGSEDLASLWELPAHAMEHGSEVPRLSEPLRRDVQNLLEAARRKRGRQMEIASRWAAGDTEADFSIQVLGDGSGHMRRDPFLPKEPVPAPKTPWLASLLRSFREAVSSALTR